MGSKSKFYFPQLDSIRGLSFLAVYFFHALHPQFGINFFGRLLKFLHLNLVLSIDVFFILSSFLLTWLGINEYKKNGNFSFINYFMRRVLRIWPLYYLLMIFSFVFVPYVAAKLNVNVTLPPAGYYLFFVSNFCQTEHVFFLTVLWTLSVEEQFYLLWGLCLFLLKKYITVCTILFIIISVGHTGYAICNKIGDYNNTLTYFFDFSIGIFSAILLQKSNLITEFFKNITRVSSLLFLLLLPIIFLLFFIVIDVLPGYYYRWLDALNRYIFSIYTGLFIIEQMVNPKPVLNLSKNKFLIYTGKISFGLYCFHGIVLIFGNVLLKKFNVHFPAIITSLIFLMVNYLVASISYKYFESPFLVLKDKLRRI